MAGFELPFNNFRDLERMAPDFSRDVSGADRQGHAYAHDASGPIERGLVHLNEFDPAYLKSQKIKPNREFVRETAQGELRIHFDKAGLPAGADLELSHMGGGHEHVTTNNHGKILADDRFNRDGVMTAHIGFDDQHRLTEVNIDAEQFDAKRRDLGPIHVAYKWDSQQHLIYAKSDEGNGVEVLHNEPGSKTIVTTNPDEGTDKDMYVYNLKTNKLDHLDVIDQDGKEYIISGKPDGSLDIEPLSRI